MSATFTETILLVKMECGSCGGVYAINARYREHKQKRGEGWHCPYCQCAWGYFGNGETDRLRKQLADKEAQILIAKSEANSERLLREAAERKAKEDQRKMKRVHNGVCPCCNRSFSNLRRHIATKHPEHIKGGKAKA